MITPSRFGDGKASLPEILRRGNTIVELGPTAVRLVDARLFQAERLDFCRRLLRSKALRGKVRKAGIDLDESICLLEFHAEDAAPQAVAATLAAALREALAEEEINPRGWFAARREPPCAGLIAYPDSDRTSVWETRSSGPGRLTLRGCDAGRRRLGRVRRVFSRLPGVEECRARGSASLEILFKSPPTNLNWVVDLAEGVIRAADRPGREVPDVPVPAENPLERLIYLGLALGAIGLAMVAVIVPGLPTVPVLIAAGYFSAKASTAVHDHLRRTIFVGPILQDLEDRHGLTPESKAKLVGLIATLGLISLAASGFDPNIALVVALAAGISLHGVLRIPTAETDRAMLARI